MIISLVVEEVIKQVIKKEAEDKVEEAIGIKIKIMIREMMIMSKDLEEVGVDQTLTNTADQEGQVCKTTINKRIIITTITIDKTTIIIKLMKL